MKRSSRHRTICKQSSARASFVAIIAILSNAVMANSAFDGLYTGLSLGGTQMQADVDAQAVSHTLTSTRTLMLSSDNAVDSYQSSLIAVGRLGYGKDLGRFYLGAEAFANIASRVAPASSATALDISQLLEGPVDTQVELNNAEFGADIRPGIFLSSTTLLYGRVGTAVNEITIETLSASFGANFSQNQSDDVLGLRLGVGLENSLSAHWSVTADYIYTDYGSATANTIAPLVPANPSLLENEFNGTTAAEVKTHTILLGLNYYPFAATKNAATGTHDNISNFNGFYAGAKGGGLLVNEKTTLSSRLDVQFQEESIFDAENELQSWNNSALGEIFFGYGNLINGNDKFPFYVGVEIFGNLAERELEAAEDFSNLLEVHPSSAPRFTNIDTVTHTIQMTLNPLEWGADMRFGSLLSNNTLLYLRVGAALNEIEAQTDSTYQRIRSSGSSARIFEETLHTEESEDVIGLRLGLGLEKMIWRQLAVTADYIFTDYGSVDLEGTMNVDYSDPSDRISTSTTIDDIHTHAALLGVVWHF